MNYPFAWSVFNGANYSRVGRPAFLSDVDREILLQYAWNVARNPQSFFEDYADFEDEINDYTETLVSALIEEQSAMTMPVGSIVGYATSSVLPDRWLYCDGSEVLKASYPLLYAVITDFYGTPVLGEDYFVLPDLRNRSMFGYDIGNPAHQFDFGSQQGAQTHTLTVAQMPAHSHSKADASTGGGVWSSIASPYQGNGVPATLWNTGETGGGNPHNNLHPVLVVNFLIYAGAE